MRKDPGKRERKEPARESHREKPQPEKSGTRGAQARETRAEGNQGGRKPGTQARKTRKQGELRKPGRQEPGKKEEKNEESRNKKNRGKKQ